MFRVGIIYYNSNPQPLPKLTFTTYPPSQLFAFCKLFGFLIVDTTITD